MRVVEYWDLLSPEQRLEMVKRGGKELTCWTYLSCQCPMCVAWREKYVADLKLDVKQEATPVI